MQIACICRSVWFSGTSRVPHETPHRWNAKNGMTLNIDFCPVLEPIEISMIGTFCVISSKKTNSTFNSAFKSGYVFVWICIKMCLQPFVSNKWHTICVVIEHYTNFCRHESHIRFKSHLIYMYTHFMQLHIQSALMSVLCVVVSLSYWFGSSQQSSGVHCE